MFIKTKTAKNILRKDVKIIKKAFIFLICLCFCFPVVVNAGEGWYFSKKAGERPVCYGNQKWVEDEGALFLGKEGDKKVYLTFDAGYGNQNVRDIANILLETKTTAAFFILPAFAKTDGELLKTLDQNGYFICNHSYSHGNMSSLSKSALEKELTKAEEYVYNTAGIKMKKYFRPPEGTFSKEMLKNVSELGYKTVFWSFAYADWDNSKQKDTEWAYQKIMSNLHDGMVILLHPNSATNAKILYRLITDIRAQGYEFGNLDQLCVSQYGEAQSGVVTGNAGFPNKIALTFDDGPHPVYTEQILDILGEYGIKATFFVVGSNAQQYPQIVSRILDEGHEIGNHTWSHKGMKNLSEKEIETEILKTHSFLKENFNYTSVVFRPPGGGEYQKAVEKCASLGYSYVLWAWRTDAKDWKCPSAESIASTVISTVKGGDIVLLHDYVAGVSSTPQALRRIIPRLLEQGYSFATVSELTNTP